jgi:multidrug efflux pump subunit AcrA (membrane-fusion protein)
VPIENQHTEQQQILHETRSEEVQEIMGRMPSWIIRWGILVVGIIIIGLFIGSNFIKYPDRVNANIVITSDNPPVNIITASTGRIQQLFVKQNDTVQKNNLLLLIVNSAKLKDVLDLKERLMFALNANNYNSLTNINYQLGELQKAHDALIVDIENKNYSVKADNSGLSIAQIKKQIAQNQQLINQMQNNESKLVQNYQIDKQMHEVDCELYKQKMLTENDYLKSKKQWLERQTSINENRNNIASNIIKQSELNKSILDIQQAKNTKQYAGISKVEQDIRTLLTDIELWEQKYIVKSPIAGRVNLYSVWKENQYVRSGENIMLIVPPIQNIISKGTIPIQNSGKIKIGQQVMISLISHPHNEFGYLKGRISYIASAPMDSVYSFDITLSQGLTTTNKKTIAPQPQMLANGEIFTDDKTLLQRLFEAFNINN